MKREELGDLSVFVVIADERSFTRAAKKMGLSQSALSHVVRRIEARLGVHLLTRTTRSVSVTEAGEQLLATLRPALGDIEARLQAISALRSTPSGTLRLTLGSHAAEALVWPSIKALVVEYPDLNVELDLDGSFADIVDGRFDAGVRLGEAIAKDMVAVRIGPEYSMALVASPAYWRKYGKPEGPQDLSRHACINIRFPSTQGLYQWEFEHQGQPVHVKVDGQLILNSMPLIIDAAVSGLGVAFVLDDQVRNELADGRLVRVMRSWCPPFAGYHLYYPSRRQVSPALRLLIDALRHCD